MAFLAVTLLVHAALALATNYGYVEWSDNDKDAEIRANHKNPAVTPVFSTAESAKEPTERTAVVAHKIEEELPRVVTAFLHTGDPSALRQVNCSRRYELSSLRGGARIASHYSLHGVLDTVAHAANFLNAILQSANGSRGRERERVGDDVHWYHALVRSVLEADAKIHRAVLTVVHAEDRHVLFLQATRRGEEVVLRDLSGAGQHHYHHLKSRTPETEWFNEFRDRKRPRVQKAAGGSSETVAETRGYFVDKSQIKWSAPYLECERGAFVPYWLLTLSAGFYGLKANSVPEFR